MEICNVVEKFTVVMLETRADYSNDGINFLDLFIDVFFSQIHVFIHIHPNVLLYLTILKN